MADIFVKDGMGNVSPYSDWTNAASLLASATGIDSAGDTIYISASHSESSTTTQTFILNGTVASPTRVLVVSDDTVASPSTLVTTPSATIATTGAVSLSAYGSGYLYGLYFLYGSGSGSTPLVTLGNGDNSNLVLENCMFHTQSTNPGARVAFGANSSGIESNIYLKDCQFKFSSSTQGINVYGTNKVTISGGGLDPTSTAITEFIKGTSNNLNVLIKGVDITRLTSSGSLVLSPLGSIGSIQFINCQLPTGWSGVPVTTVSNTGMRLSLYNCYTSLVNYRIWIVTSAGIIRDNITIIKNGGSIDRDVPVSWSLATNPSANELINPLITDTMPRWVDSIGTPKTLTIDFIHDSGTALDNSQIWIELDYLDNTDNHLKTITNKRSGIFTPATAHPASTASWNSSPLVSPNKQKLEITFTPQSIGIVYIRVCLAIPNYTVYMDYSPTIA